jgi:hypothetical protein
MTTFHENECNCERHAVTDHVEQVKLAALLRVVSSARMHFPRCLKQDNCRLLASAAMTTIKAVGLLASIVYTGVDTGTPVHVCPTRLAVQGACHLHLRLPYMTLVPLSGCHYR